jgi:hypothetical protein
MSIDDLGQSPPGLAGRARAVRLDLSQVNVLEAPTYPPAIGFEPPVAASYVVQLENSSLAELMKIPAAWAIVLEHLPALKLMTATPMLKPHLGNMTVLSLSAFIKMATPEVLAAIDRELARLPPVAESPQ